ncbi:MAG: RNA methyltransferase [Gracilibacteraceae bacterium]|jgi:hypothetical protein|nr:RNA methyltransferase [Gracilibacteraceae bacterium]
MAKLYLALVHAPVYNKNRELVATSITNMDIHDIARASATYGVEQFYIVHPAPAQQDIARRVMRFWQEGAGAAYNPHRTEALACVRLVDTLPQAAAEIRTREKGRRLYTVATAAHPAGHPAALAYAALRSRLESDEDAAWLLLFGTGWGLTAQTMEEADYLLPPLNGPGSYNHLSVRSAVSVILDRLRSVHSLEFTVHSLEKTDGG